MDVDFHADPKQSSSINRAANLIEKCKSSARPIGPLSEKDVLRCLGAK